MKTMFVKLFGVAVVAVTLSACSGGVVVQGGSGNDPYYQAWYDVYGTYCGNGTPSAGCNFYADGSKITAGSDPYYASSSLYYDYWTYTDSYGYSASYNGYAWLSQDGILYDQYGNALNEVDADAAASADVISQAAAQEAVVTTTAGKALAQKYALAEDTGVMISKTLQDWATLGRSRARTNADVADFSSRLYGIDATKATTAITQALQTQNQQPLDDLNVDVAAHWGTSPEVSKQILKGWYKSEVNTYGIK